MRAVGSVAVAKKTTKKVGPAAGAKGGKSAKRSGAPGATPAKRSSPARPKAVKAKTPAKAAPAKTKSSPARAKAAKKAVKPKLTAKPHASPGTQSKAAKAVAPKAAAKRVAKPKPAPNKLRASREAIPPKKILPPPVPHLDEEADGDEEIVLAAPVESPLTSREREQFRQMLLEKRAEILGNVTTLHREAVNKDRADAAGDVSAMPIHMADIGSDNYELEFTLGLIEGERAILREIEEAIERLDKGTYGVCLATGKPIGRARLKAKPWAKYCYEYTLAQEKGQIRRF